MPINCSKIKPYIGFAIKSRKFLLGTDNIEKNIRLCEIILVSDKLSDSSTEKLKNLSNSHHIPIYILSSENFFELLGNASVKAIAITDKNLSAAIKNHLD